MQTFATNLLVLAAGLVSSVAAARWLLPEGRGEVAAALLWPTVIPYLGVLGAVEALVYYSARPGADTKAIFANSVLFGMGVSVVLTGVGYALLPWLLSGQSGDVVHSSRVYLMSVPLVILAEFTGSLLRGRLRLGTYNIQRLIVPVGYLIGLMLLQLLDSLTIYNIVALYLALAAVRVAACFVMVRRFSIAIGLKPNRVLARQMLRFGGQAHVGTFSQIANGRIDQMLIATWLPPADLGLYVVAVNAAQIIQALSQVFQVSALPQIAALPDRASQMRLLTTVFQVYWVCSLVATPVLCVLLWVGIPVLYGDEYGSAVWAAMLLLVSSLCVGARLVLSGGTRALGVPWLSSRAELLSMVVSFVGLWLTLPWIGILGAAATASVASAFALIVTIHGLSTHAGLPASHLLQLNRKALTRVASSMRSAVSSQ